jgi:hypothetical protein
MHGWRDAPPGLRDAFLFFVHIVCAVSNGSVWVDEVTDCKQDLTCMFRTLQRLSDTLVNVISLTAVCKFLYKYDVGRTRAPWPHNQLGPASILNDLKES